MVEPIPRETIDQAVADTGRWIGLCNGDGVPVVQLPPPVSMSAAERRLAPDAELELVVPARGKLAPTNAAVDYLIAEDLGRFDDEGYLVPATEGNFFVVVCLPGRRLAYEVVKARAEGPADAPSTLTIEGVSSTSLLQAHPAPSVPWTWHKSFWENWEGDAGGAYETIRRYAPVEMATRLDGYTIEGPAVSAIRRLCHQSFAAVNALQGWEGDPHLVVDYSVPSADGRRVVMPVTDDYLWDTFASTAEAAGVNVWTELWWPGDAPMLVPTGIDPEKDKPVLTTYQHPVFRVCVEEVDRD
ncbi:hypothetical protein [Corynebacterium sp. p3-SID1194]|uniref:hypothetical protein n=1 Tax=Corynebacterium sp. p3-SID1194 TaxID=2916105 RepID=UPI0021A8FDB4|nr:hypothetical protein [Corynebacterium sp. p3-SID1194]MCT1450651.1 hypothetical protein [Corynebacterium sp. p3-SID1194]